MKENDPYGAFMETAERRRYELPHPRGIGKGESRRYEPDFLSDYVTLMWFSNTISDFVECQVEPERVDWFKENQEKVEGKIDWNLEEAVEFMSVV